jgi:glycosyltransferase involved in cell wall biosynthesis
MSSQPPRLLIVEEALRDYTGHWYEYNRAVVAMHRDRHIATTVAAHHQVIPAIQEELNAQPVFRHTNWDGIYNAPRPWQRYGGIAQHNWRVVHTMEQFFRHHQPFDLVFVPTVIIYHWLAWRWLLQRHRGKAFQRLVLFIRNNAGSYPNGATTPIFKRSTLILKWTIQSFAPYLRAGMVVIGTDSARHAREYQLLTGLEVTVFPSPRAELAQNAPARNQNQPMVLSCLGPPRLEKGIDLLLEAIAQVLTQHPDLPAQFVVQWNRPVVLPDGTLLAVPEMLRSHPKLTLIAQDLSSADYARFLLESDAVVLPYRRESYYTRLSGLVVEASTSGIPVLYTADTWMEDAVTAYGAGLAVRDGDVSDLAAKMVQVVQQRDLFRAAAIAQMPRARDYHSDEHFLRCLWGTLP